MNSASASPTGVRWWIFGLSGAISWLLYLHRYSWGVLKTDFKRENRLDDVQMSWLDSAFLATYAFGQIPFGLAGDLLGPRAIMAVLIFLWSVSVALFAIIQGFWWLFILRLFFGFFQAGVYPLLSKVTRIWFPLAYRTSVQGFVTALGRVGGACAPLVIASLLIGFCELTWPNALLVVAGPGAVLAVAFWWTFRNHPAEHPWVNAAECREIGTDLVAAAGSPPAPVRLTPDNRLSFLVLLVYAFASTFADMLYVFWIPQFLEEAKELSKWEMGLFAPLPLLGGAVGGLVGGMLNDVLIRWTGRRRLGRSTVAFTGKFLAGILIAASVGVADGRLVMLVLLVSKFFGDWSLPTQWGTITDIAGPAAGTVFAVVNTVGAVAGFLASPAMAWTKETWGWEGLFFGVAAVYLIAAACWLVIDCTRRLDQETKPRGEASSLGGT